MIDHEIYFDHSINFERNGDVRNSYLQFKLIPTSRPIIKRPDVKTNYVEIPGADGVLDYTEALNGLKYNNRKGSWEFTRYNAEHMTETEWAEEYTQLLTYFHGKKFDKVYLQDETYPDGSPRCFYRGRVEVNEWKSDAQFSHITLDYNLEPYKETVAEKTTYRTEWLWDDLFAGESVSPIRYGTFSVSGSKCRGFLSGQPAGSKLHINMYSSASCTYYNVTNGTGPFQVPSGVSAIDIEVPDRQIGINDNGNRVILKFVGTTQIRMSYDGGGLSL